MSYTLGGVSEIESDDDGYRDENPRHQNRRIPVVAPPARVTIQQRGAWPVRPAQAARSFRGLGAVSQPNYAAIDAGAARVMAQVPGLFAALDRIPSPPSYPAFNQEFKTRPVSAMLNLLTPIENLAKDTITNAVSIGGLNTLNIRPPGVPAQNVKMGLGLPPQITNVSTKEALTRLLIVQNFMILGFMRPQLLAAGFVKALVDESRRGITNAQRVAGIATGLVRAAVAGGFSLGATAPSFPARPGSAFLLEAAKLVKSNFPTLPLFTDAKAAAKAVADVVAKVAPVLRDYNVLLARVGPANALLVAEVYARGDSGLKNAADSLKSRALSVMSSTANLPRTAKDALSAVASNADRIKANASDAQGHKSNRMSPMEATVKAARYSPDARNLLSIPVAFAGLGGLAGGFGEAAICGMGSFGEAGSAAGYNFGGQSRRSLSGLGELATVASGAAAGEGAATVTTAAATAEVAAPAAAPPAAAGIGATITAAVTAAVASAAAGAVTTASGAATAGAIRTVESGSGVLTSEADRLIPGGIPGQSGQQPQQTNPNQPGYVPPGGAAGGQAASGGGSGLLLGGLTLLAVGAVVVSRRK